MCLTVFRLVQGLWWDVSDSVSFSATMCQIHPCGCGALMYVGNKAHAALHVMLTVWRVASTMYPRGMLGHSKEVFLRSSVCGVATAVRCSWHWCILWLQLP
jgi:hypothetical protein